MENKKTCKKWMYKNISVIACMLIIILFVVPFVSAAWLNPISWFNNCSFLGGNLAGKASA